MIMTAPKHVLSMVNIFAACNLARRARKALKANWVRESNQAVPKLFNLCKIAEAAALNLSKEQTRFLVDLAIFDLEKPEIDDELKAFKLCTKEFTHEQFGKVKELYRFLISPLHSEPIRNL